MRRPCLLALLLEGVREDEWCEVGVDLVKQQKTEELAEDAPWGARLPRDGTRAAIRTRWVRRRIAPL